MQGALAGKTVLIAGGGSGLGRAVALSAGGAGALVVVADRDGAAARATAALVTAAGGAAEALAVDSLDLTAWDTAVREAVANCGGLDGAFNAAGTGGPLQARPRNAGRTGLAAAAGGLWYAIRAEAAQMRDQPGGGVIVNAAAEPGVPDGDARAVVDLSRAVSLEHAETAVRVLAVWPGWRDPPVPASALSRALGARPDPPNLDDPAQTVTWLLARATGVLNGAALPVGQAEGNA